MTAEKHKFQEIFSHTYEDAFRWRYEYYIKLMLRFAEKLGREKLIGMIKQSSDESTMVDASDGKDFSLEKFIRSGNTTFKNMITSEVVEKTDRVYEMRVTECLWTKIFKEFNAEDIGYATVCHGDFADARAAHPKLRLERTKTLMQGHDCCNHRWIFEG
jgi:hypothetical protein